MRAVAARDEVEVVDRRRIDRRLERRAPGFAIGVGGSPGIVYVLYGVGRREVGSA